MSTRKRTGAHLPFGDTFEWTEAAEATLRRMWRAGFDSGEIASMLGCTKNAVVGKRNRLQLETRREGIRGSKTDITPFRRLPEPPQYPYKPPEERPGWPTLAQLMGRRA